MSTGADVLRDRIVDGLRPLRFRGKARLLSPLVPRRGVREAWVHGCRMRLDLADHIQRHVYMGTFERRETSFALRWLRPGDVFVDVGANVGYYVALAARRVGPAGRVAAFEPSPYAFERLQALILDNDLSWVRALPLALGAAAGHADLPAPLDGNHTPSLLDPADGRAVVRVPVARLDAQADAWDGRPIDLLKLDVEGYEPRVLDGAEGLLAAGRIRAVLCELNATWLARAGSSIDDLLRRLDHAGFSPPAGEARSARELDGQTLPFIHRSARDRLRR